MISIRYVRAAGIGCLSVGVGQMIGWVPGDDLTPLVFLLGSAASWVVLLALMDWFSARLRHTKGCICVNGQGLVCQRQLNLVGNVVHPEHDQTQLPLIN